MKFENTLLGRPNTLKTQRNIFKNWVLPYKDQLIKHPDATLSSMVKDMSEKGMKPGTIRAAISLATRFVEHELGTRPNSKAILRFLSNSVNQTEPKCWTREEAKKALEVCKSEYPEMYLPLLLTLHTGIRKGELCGLTWEDVDWLKGTLKIARSYDGPTKSGKSRIIPISRPLANYFERCYIIGQDNCPIFEGGDLNYHLKKICRLARVKVISWHGLRHTFGTLALEDGVSPRLVQFLLGHSTLSTTLNIYWNLTKEEVDFKFLP